MNSHHDPLCPVDLPRMGPPATCFWCEVIARVHADERTRLSYRLRALDHAEADKWRTLAVAAQMARDDLRAEAAAFRAALDRAVLVLLDQEDDHG